MNEEARVEQQLLALARATAYPPTPDLAAGFWRRLESERARKAPATPLSLATVGLAALVIAVSLIIGTVTPVREATADLFDRINIFETDEPLDTLPTDIAGEEVTLSEAQVALGRQIKQPSSPEGLVLERVVLQDFKSVKAAVLFYTQPDGAPFLLYATNSQVGKGLPQGGDSTSTPVAIPLKDVGFWLEGRHLVQLYGPDGVIPGSERVTDANTLVWPEDDFVYKIEGHLARAEAIAVAASVR